MSEKIRENIERVWEAVERAAVRAGRKRDDIRLMAVSKTVDPDRIRAAYGFGQKLFGENRVQEARDKRGAFPPDAELHLIGHLQRNKAASAAGLFSTVQSIDKVETAEALSREVTKLGKTADILLEVNTSGEDSKHGVRDENGLMRLIDGVLGLPGLTVRGLMTVGPLTDDAMRVRESFRNLKTLYERASTRYRELGLSVLSMGMSSDFETAVEEGSTLIRIGTAIFGDR